jgi:voltage-gated potassium channel
VAELGPSAVWRRARWPLLLITAILLYAVLGYTVIEGWSALDSLYFTLQILTTVGFGETRPLDTSGKVFTITVIALGVAVVLITLSVLAVWIAELAAGDNGRRKRMAKRVQALRDHVMICAYGRVGRAVARELESQAAPFVVIDINEDLVGQMEQDGVAFLIGDPSEEHVLREAGVGECRALVCAVDSDATNVYITLVARSLRPDLFIVARASEAAAADRLYRAGADRVISPYVTSGRHMAQLSLRPRVIDYLEVSTAEAHPLRVEELRIDEQLAERTVGEVSGAATALAVGHADGGVTPNPDLSLRLRPGDLVILLGEQEALRPAEGV